MYQFMACLECMESHDQGEDVGGDGKGRRCGYGAVFQFASFLISFQYDFFLFLHGFSTFLLAVCFIVFMQSFYPYSLCIYSWNVG